MLVKSPINDTYEIFEIDNKGLVKNKEVSLTPHEIIERGFIDFYKDFYKDDNTDGIVDSGPYINKVVSSYGYLSISYLRNSPPDGITPSKIIEVKKADQFENSFQILFQDNDRFSIIESNKNGQNLSFEYVKPSTPISELNSNKNWELTIHDLDQDGIVDYLDKVVLIDEYGSFKTVHYSNQKLLPKSVDDEFSIQYDAIAARKSNEGFKLLLKGKEPSSLEGKVTSSPDFFYQIIEIGYFLELG